MRPASSPDRWPSGRARVGAAVDIGSVSAHLLVAAIDGHELTPIVDESAFLGLGRTVVDQGYLGAAIRSAVADTLAGFARTARGHGATGILVLGTEPVRRALDGAAIAAAVEAASGVPLHVLTHEEEAYLTLIGVTEGRPVSRETMVVDIGGGSSEFCVVDAVRRPRAAGLQVGASRWTDRYVHHDPPTAPEVDAMRVAASEILRLAPDAEPTDIVAVGGTASNLVKVLPEANLDRRLTRDRLAAVQASLAREPSDRAAEHHGVRPLRARILPAGAAILDAVLARYGVDEIRVSRAGIREGAILVAEHGGRAWRDRLADLAHGWRT